METHERAGGARQVLIGLDAAEWDLVTEWVQAGKLPTFQRLITCGMRGRLATVAAQLPDAVWPALCTGVNPARFEKYFYVQYDPQTMDLRHVSDKAIQRAPFWNYLSQAGRRVGIVDVPLFPLSRSLNGFQLANWGVHPVKAKAASYPDSLLEEVTSRFGPHPGGDCGRVDDKPEPLRKLRRRLLQSVQVRGRMIRSLMQERPWDVFVAAFSETHCSGHLFWRFLDPPPSRPITAETEDLKDTLEQIYKAIDHELAEIMALGGEETSYLFFAGHGMGPLYHASWNLPEILDLLGYGRHPASQVKPDREPHKAVSNPWRILKMALPGPLQYWIKAQLPQAVQNELLFRWYAGSRRWEGCRAFAVPNNESIGAIRISVKGRDCHGIVEPGAEYQRVCSELKEALLELTDVRGGRPIVKQVTFAREEFCGPFLDQLPDLAVLWEQSFPWESVYSPRFGQLHLRRQDARSGSHTPHGFVLAMGPGVPSGIEVNGSSIYSIGPTVLDLAGVPIPPEFEGAPLSVRADKVKVMAH
jgi:predicted AlkP superfamily phosphohydrolase/phosphomutase